VAKEAFEELLSTLQQDSKLSLTEEEWDARHVRRDAEKQGPGGSGGSSTPAGHGRRGSSDCGRGRGCGNGGHGPQKNDECRRHGKLGHWACECKSKPKKEQANAVHEEEVLLMVAKVTIRQRSKEDGVLAAADAGAAQAAAEIHEERVYHMTGSRAAFVDLDMRVQGTWSVSTMTPQQRLNCVLII
jgi:hypothetical protein